MARKSPLEPRLPKDRSDHPVTMGVFEEHRQEMRAFENRVIARFEAVDKRGDSIDKRFDEVDKRFDAVDKRFDAIDKRFDAIDKRFDAVDKRFDELTALMRSGFAEMKQLYHQGLVHIEEMRHENRLMAEQLNGLFHRQKDVERRVDGFESTLKRLRKTAPDKSL